MSRLLGKHMCLADAFRCLDLNVNQKIGPQEHAKCIGRESSLKRWQHVFRVILKDPLNTKNSNCVSSLCEAKQEP